MVQEIQHFGSCDISKGGACNGNSSGAKLGLWLWSGLAEGE